MSYAALERIALYRIFRSIQDQQRQQEVLAMALKPKPTRKGIPLAGNFAEKDGKIVKKDTAPPHVRAGRRRKANKVTGARAAK